MSQKASWQYHFAIGCLVITFAFGLVIRIIPTITKQKLRHDESISYAVATGHMADFHTGPFGEWTLVSDWQCLCEVEDLFIFDKISQELATYSAHPPFYFWLLHLWTLVTLDFIHIKQRSIKYQRGRAKQLPK